VRKRRVSSFVLDASAFLAYLRNEAGFLVVESALLQRASISAINWAEVLSKVADLGDDPLALTRKLEAQGLLGRDLEIVTLTQADSLAIAQLRPLTKSMGLSLGDPCGICEAARACIALGQRLGLPILTGDRVWAELSLNIEIRLIR
jgi:ribonuclease VapC